MAQIPEQHENPNGLHGKYLIRKIVPNPHYDPNAYWMVDRELYSVVDCDKDAEYFVMRLDTGGSDIEHIKACRIGIHAYADAIEATIPQLAKDLRERYPLLTTP